MDLEDCWPLASMLLGGVAALAFCVLAPLPEMPLFILSIIGASVALAVYTALMFAARLFGISWCGGWVPRPPK